MFRSICIGIAGLVFVLLRPTVSPHPQARSSERSVPITVDASQAVGRCDPKLWACVGYDPLYAATVREESIPFWQLVRRTRAIRYVRCHNVFSDGLAQRACGPVRRLLESGELSLVVRRGRSASPSEAYFGCRVYREDERGRPQYNFWHLDHVYDVFLSAGVKPIVECDFMPDALADGEPVRNYGGGLVNTPRDFRKWRDLIHETVKHCIARYGREEVRTWYWEVWNEPDLAAYFIDGGPFRFRAGRTRLQRFLKMYDHFVDAVKTADPEIPVGGPGIAGRIEWLRSFLEHCTRERNYVTGRTGTPIDFISWHCYGPLSRQDADRQAKMAVVREFPSLSQCEIHLNEWGQRLRPNPPTVMTNFEAAFLCRFIAGLYGDADHAFNLFLRWGQPTASGWRPLAHTHDGQLIRLAILNAYILLAKLGPQRIALEADGDGRVCGFA
ncbi:MAG TPA: hypothetical protein EYP56_19670, partial [Planctomycetaceae bacterium]|nr:hypothetical protein [Planctomycetaceae bacterium]